VNEQEAFRATAAREMFRRGDWIVPTLRGDPYLAKPPMIYWIQLAMARVRGVEPGLFELRLTTALAGWLGVIATYFVARRLARSMSADHAEVLAAARWSALGLATGILFVRSARSGEIDILLAAPVVIAIGALHAGWESGVERRRTHWRAILIATIACAFAALSKGPVPLAIVAITLVGAWIADRRRTFGALWRTHAEIPILVGFAALWAWGAMVKAHIGAGAVDAAAAREIEDNLRLFVLESPINNLEFLAYGMIPIGIGAIAAIVWCIRDRPRASRAGLILGAWLIGGFILFSVAGKGVARYLTPVWPCLAMMGGIWIVLIVRPWAIHRAKWVSVRDALAVVFLAFGIAQGAWYAVLRPKMYGSRSPRDIAEAMVNDPELSPERIGIWDISPRTLEYHLDHPVPRWTKKNFDALADTVRAGPGEYWLLAQRETDRVVAHRGSVRTMLTDAGFAWDVREIGTPWVFDPKSTPVELLRIRVHAP